MLPQHELVKFKSEQEKFDDNLKRVFTKINDPRARLELLKLSRSVDRAWRKFYSIATEKNTSHLSSYKPKFEAAYDEYKEALSVANQWLLIARLEA